jgi:hypothetical protein
LLSYIPGTTKVDAVDEVLHSKEQILILLQQNLQQAQQRMKTTLSTTHKHNKE